MRVLIVDDEEPARALLRAYLAQRRDCEVVGECANGFEAVKAVAELQPDLVLLDIQMPKLSGFEVLELLEAPPAVIFVTAHDEYALKAFDVHAVDYLLKPVEPDRLGEALDSAARRSAAAAPPSPRELAAAARPEGQHLDRILVREGTDVHVLLLDRIDYLEARDDQVCIRVGEQEYLKSERLGRLEEALPPTRFVRIHRSYLLNLDRLAKVELYAKDSRLAILRDGSRLPISRAGYTRLRELL